MVEQLSHYPVRENPSTGTRVTVQFNPKAEQLADDNQQAASRTAGIEYRGEPVGRDQGWTVCMLGPLQDKCS